MEKVIHLKDYSDNYATEKTEQVFYKAYATNSRMMGVIGIRLHFEGLVLFFHLDYEEYGFDRFEACTDEAQVEVITQSFMGGLGADLVAIDLDEASALIYEAVDIGNKYFYDMPLEFFDYEYLLDEEPKPLEKKTYNKITCPMVNDFEKINYFLMRSAGHDLAYRDLMLASGPLSFQLCEEPTLLLKNEIEKTDGAYICKSVIDFHDAYKLIVTQIRMDQVIHEAEILNELNLTAKEASFLLNKKELILACHTEDVEAFCQHLENLQPSIMKNIYAGGSLFTLFHSHNKHVQKPVYYLNEDILGIIYVTDTHQVVVACFNEGDLKWIKAMLEEDFPEVGIMMELEAETPIVYSFVNTGQQDFLDFIGE